jgi:soluble lytic murein transglycosylase-like protein
MTRAPILNSLVIACLVFLHGQAFADIYVYIDSNGVLNFSNTPVSSGYELYLKEEPEQRTGTADTKKYDDIILEAYHKYGVDFPLIKAVIDVESGFNEKAVSKKGARGLMQIMPDNFASLSVNDPFDPVQNIMGGTLHLKRLLKRYGYRLPLALAAYNAGPDAVDRYQSIPPYRETKEYVQKVLKAYRHYKNP